MNLDKFTFLLPLFQNPAGLCYALLEDLNIVENT